MLAGSAPCHARRNNPRSDRGETPNARSPECGRCRVTDLCPYKPTTPPPKTET
ncbi:hypothetical protein FSZ31_11685 [Sphingorhabdus soli]|uniref:Uncharacterized protein n=1 Tax=Flavisphingopyxis soli TaxID=2601267 RepID=A0A5C6U7S7_9SPHN|nr:hypothetical protein FSZ31_11685 [Sphingorhabdus soli]